VAGVGLAGLGNAPGYSHLDLLGLAVQAALADAGLGLKEVDGLFTANMSNILPTLAVGEYLGLQPKVAVGTNTGGNSFVDHLLWAALALQPGHCEVALICYGSNQRSGKTPPPDAPPYEALYRPREPISSYALAAARHMHQYGTTRDHLAAVAVAARDWARLNPRAFVRDPLSLADVLSSRMICDPLSLLDCSLVTDGAGAVILTRADRARLGKQPPEADRQSLHVEAAQRVEVIGPAPARESYLRVDRIIEAALRSGAQAIQPGYGFLSENADFAQAVLDARLVWIGPSPETIAEMGNNPRARELAAEAGVPVLPAERLDGDAPDAALALAERIGFPLLIKAAAGGGGIGIQRVDSPEALQQAIERTRSLGSRLFGSGQVYLERFIPIARHIEVQVLGDGRGRVIHLFERDCSVQRRFQKVIEETPAPALREETRAALCRDAVRFAESLRGTRNGGVHCRCRNPGALLSRDE
jgi:acetyl-CoA acetyltransferase